MSNSYVRLGLVAQAVFVASWLVAASWQGILRRAQMCPDSSRG
ncbi:hypothetical protein [Microlunatus elymi]|nr:hypothetical protein [Microlunatus elymi]